jgi:drug/metabolite transporter (DMT)-like permease
MRIAAPVLGPLVVTHARVVLAGGALLGYAASTHQHCALRSCWKDYVVLGALNAVIPLTLVATAVVHLNASIAAMLNATTPLFTAFIAAVWLKESLRLSQCLGLVLGLLGVAVLVGWSPLPFTSTVGWAVGASLTAALFYGIAGVYTKAKFAGMPPLALTVGQQLGAAVLLLPFAVATRPTTVPSPTVIGAVLALALVSTAVGYLLYFYLIAHIGPTKTLTVTFLIPVFGLLAGVLFLGESVSGGMLVGLAIIFVSVLLVTGVRVRLPRRSAAEQL